MKLRGEISSESSRGKTSFESSQDQDRVEREARVRDSMAIRGQPSSLAHCMDLCTQGPIEISGPDDNGSQVKAGSVEHEVRVELWPSLLVVRIAASLTITRAMSGTSASIYIKQSPRMYVCVCESACQAMGATTTAPIVTKLGQQTLLITCLKVILPHLRFEAILRPESRSKVRSKMRSTVPFTALHRP